MKNVLAPWYRPRGADIVLGRALLAPAREGIRAALISGPPGVGKTAYAQAFAKALGGRLFFFLCHHWVAEEDLFVRVDPARVAALAAGLGESPEECYVPGILLRAALSSHEGPTVLLIDELDKAPERVDALLLDFLQSGAVRGPLGQEWKADSQQLYVFLTENGLRPVSEPLLRRVFRHRMTFLPPETEADVLRKQTGAPTGVVRLVVRMLNIIRTNGATSPSLQEARRLLDDLRVATSATDAGILLDGWLVKEDEDRAALQAAFGNDPGAILWGEWLRGRRPT